MNLYTTKLRSEGIQVNAKWTSISEGSLKNTMDKANNGN